MPTTIQIAEGEAKTASGNDIIVFPGVNSCLTIVSINGPTRRGGHAVLQHEPGQMSLQEMCDYLGTAGREVHIIGDIGTWDDNWANLEQTKDLRINGAPIKSVWEMATALSATGQIKLADINGKTQDVHA